jgi:hypothetical protein
MRRQEGIPDARRVRPTEEFGRPTYAEERIAAKALARIRGRAPYRLFNNVNSDPMLPLD